MRGLFSILALIFCVNIGLTQGNTDWVDSVLTKIILNEIKVFDESLQLIINSDVELVTQDTVINDSWTRPQYVNNILQKSFDGVLVEDQIIFDTATNRKDREYIDFKFSEFDEYDNYLKDKIAFTVHRKQLKTHSEIHYPKSMNYLKGTKWVNDKVELEHQEIELDSCHKVFKLSFNKDFTFIQEYGNSQNSCRTPFMEEEKRVGVEGDTHDFRKYHNKIQGHYLKMSKGKWQLLSNRLLLFDLKKKTILTFEVERLDQEDLYLKFEKTNYKIRMKKVSH